MGDQGRAGPPAALSGFGPGRQPGAHVLRLDVDREREQGPADPRDPRDKIGRWDEEYRRVRVHVVVLRYAWVGQGSAPRNARLIVALQQALPESARLAQLVTLMGRAVAPFRDLPGLLVAQYIPGDLRDLLVGRLR